MRIKDIFLSFIHLSLHLLRSKELLISTLFYEIRLSSQNAAITPLSKTFLKLSIFQIGKNNFEILEPAASFLPEGMQICRP